MTTSILQDDTELLQMLKEHEGFSSKPYYCPAGKLTVGYGHNLDDRGITRATADSLLREDVGVAVRDLYSVIPTFGTFSKQRQYAIIDMMFNLGLPAFRKFERMITAVNANDWNAAADEMKNSAWYKQVGLRSKRLERMMREG